MKNYVSSLFIALSFSAQASDCFKEIETFKRTSIIMSDIVTEEEALKEKIKIAQKKGLNTSEEEENLREFQELKVIPIEGEFTKAGEKMSKCFHSYSSRMRQ